MSPSGGWGGQPWGESPWGIPPVVHSGLGRIYYRLALADRGTAGLGTVIEDDVLSLTGVPQGGSLRFTKVLNGANAIEFELPIDHPFVSQANFGEDAVGARELHLYRNEVLVFAGRLWSVDLDSKVSLRCTGEGWWSIPRRWEINVDKVYRASNGPWDQLDIAWDLIADQQALTGAAQGFTRGSPTASGVNRKVIICKEERRTVADAVEDLSSADDGFDFELDPEKVWRTWFPRRGSASGITLDCATNVVDLQSLQIDGGQLSNEVAGVGSSEDCDDPVILLATDTGARDDYGLLQSNVTRTEFDMTDFEDTSFLWKLIDEELRITKAPRWQAQVLLRPELAEGAVTVPDFADYDLGDTLTLTASKGFATFTKTMKITEEAVEVRPGGFELVSLTLDGAV